MNINGYDQDQYRLEFFNNNIYTEAIKRDKWLSNVTLQFDAWFSFKTLFRPKMDNDFNTPRLINLHLNSSFSIAALYYLDFLLEKNPQVVVDIGCGANIFKRLIPCIHGIDPTPNNPYADEFGLFDKEFSQAHKDQYESVFSICSLHFTSLSNFGKKLLEFINIIKPGGRGFITFNLARMLEHTRYNDFQKLFDTQTPDPQMLTDYVNLVIQQITQVM